MQMIDLHRSIYHWKMNGVASFLSGISPILDQKTMYSLMIERGNISRFNSAIGSKNVCSKKYLDDDPSKTTKSGINSDTSSEISETEEDFFETPSNTLQYEIGLYELAKYFS